MHLLPAQQEGGIRAALVILSFSCFWKPSPVQKTQKLVKLDSGLSVPLVVDVSTKSKLKILLSGKELEDIL